MSEQDSGPSTGPSYPMTMAKNGNERQAHDRAEELRLRFDGFRSVTDPPVTRGEFLPPVPESSASDATQPAPGKSPAATSAEPGQSPAEDPPDAGERPKPGPSRRRP